MVSEAVAKKALKYLEEGRVRFPASSGTRVTISSPSGSEYEALLSAGEWTCNCPSRSPECAHVAALRLITQVETHKVYPDHVRSSVDDFLES